MGNSMTKKVREEKGKSLKSTKKQPQTKVGKFCKGGRSYLLESSEKMQGQKQEIFGKGEHNFLMETRSQKQGKEENCNDQKQQLFD